MFEEIIYGYQRRDTGTSQNRLYQLLREDAFDQVASAVEKEGQWSFNASEKAQVLRRIRDLYTRRKYPEATFEEWHSVAENAEVPTDEIEPSRKRQKTSNHEHIEENVTDYDGYVKNRVLQEIKEERATTVQSEDSGAGLRAGPLEEPKEDSSSSSSDSESSSSESSDSSDMSDAYSTDGEASAPDSDTEDTEKSKKKNSDKPTKKASTADSDEDGDIDSALDEGLNADAVFAMKKLKQWANGQDPNRTWLRDHYDLRKSGYEISDDLEGRPHKSVQRQHLITLNSILHLKILEKDWHTAFKAFSILIKLPRADLRSLWPLGIEILTQLRDEARRNAPGRISGRQEQIKVRNFYDWVKLSFPLYQRPLVSLGPNNGSVFRSGSKTHVPMYVVAGLWDLLAEKQYTRLRDSLDEMLLIPPYDQDGTLHYMMILCCLSENADLIYLYEDFGSLDDLMERSAEIGDLAEDISLIASKDSMKSRIFTNISKISELAEDCESHNFEIPKQLLEQEMENARIRLADSPPETDDVPSQQNLIDTTPVPGYTFRKGKITATDSKTAAIPKKFWSRLVTDKHPGELQHWTRAFFYDPRGKGPIDCLICGSTFQRSKLSEIEQHLTTHGITRENHRKKRAQLREYDMAKMVESQSANLPSRRNFNWTILPPSKKKTEPKKPTPQNQSSSPSFIDKDVVLSTEAEPQEKTIVNENQGVEHPEDTPTHDNDVAETQQDVLSNENDEFEPQEEELVDENDVLETQEEELMNENDDLETQEEAPVNEKDEFEPQEDSAMDENDAVEPHDDTILDANDEAEPQEDALMDSNEEAEIQQDTPLNENDEVEISTAENIDSGGRIYLNYVPTEDSSDGDEWEDEDSEEIELDENPSENPVIASSSEENLPEEEESSQDILQVPNSPVGEENSPDEIAPLENLQVENSTYGNSPENSPDQDTPAENLPFHYASDDKSQVGSPVEEKDSQLLGYGNEGQINQNEDGENNEEASTETPISRDPMESEVPWRNTTSPTPAEVFENAIETNVKQEDSATEPEPTTSLHLSELENDKRVKKSKKKKRSKSKRRVKDEESEWNSTSLGPSDSVAALAIHDSPSRVPLQQEVSHVIPQPSTKVEDADFDSVDLNRNEIIQNDHDREEQQPRVHFEDRPFTPAEESPEPENGAFAHDGIDDSLDLQRNSSSQSSKTGGFEGFSPDTTAENETFAQDISRVFEHYATQTQESQRRSQSVENQEPTRESSENPEWKDGFSSDSNEDSSVNFTRFVTDSVLGNDPNNGPNE